MQNRTEIRDSIEHATCNLLRKSMLVHRLARAEFAGQLIRKLSASGTKSKRRARTAGEDVQPAATTALSSWSVGS